MKVDNQSLRSLHGLNGLRAVIHVDKDSDLGAGLVIFHPMLKTLEDVQQQIYCRWRNATSEDALVGLCVSVAIDLAPRLMVGVYNFLLPQHSGL